VAHTQCSEWCGVLSALCPAAINNPMDHSQVMPLLAEVGPQTSRLLTARISSHDAMASDEYNPATNDDRHVLFVTPGNPSRFYRLVTPENTACLSHVGSSGLAALSSRESRTTVSRNPGPENSKPPQPYPSRRLSRVKLWVFRLAAALGLPLLFFAAWNLVCALVGLVSHPLIRGNHCGRASLSSVKPMTWFEWAEALSYIVTIFGCRWPSSFSCTNQRRERQNDEESFINGFPTSIPTSSTWFLTNPDLQLLRKGTVDPFLSRMNKKNASWPSSTILISLL